MYYIDVYTARMYIGIICTGLRISHVIILYVYVIICAVYILTSGTHLPRDNIIIILYTFTTSAR